MAAHELLLEKCNSLQHEKSCIEAVSKEFEEKLKIEMVEKAAVMAENQEMKLFNARVASDPSKFWVN